MSEQQRKESTAFHLQFEETVDITEYFYPDFSIVEFLSNIGGSMGLWLGVGVIQFAELCSTIFSKILKSFAVK